MNRKHAALLAALTSIAAGNKEGFTVSAATLRPVNAGYAVAVADTQNSFDLEGLVRVVEYVESHEDATAFGGWYNEENGKFYFDVTIICGTLEEAKEIGRANDQIAIFDLSEKKEIRL